MPRTPKTSLVPPSGWMQPVARSEAEFSLGFVVSMTLVGGLLRLLFLVGQSLWVDEILTWHAVRPDAALSFWEQFRDTIQGPLYLAVVWPLVRAWDPELMLRLPALIAGVLAVPVFGWLSFRLLNGRAARLALLLFALNPFLIWYSQEGRGYSFLILFSLLTALAYLELADRPRPARAVVFALAATGLILSNLSGVFLLVAMLMTMLIWQRPRSRAAWGWWLLGGGLTLLLTGPWLLKASGIWAIDRIVPGGGTGQALRGSTTFSPLALPYTLFTFFFGYSLGPSLRELHQPGHLGVLQAYLPVLGAGFGAVGIVLLAGLVRWNRRLLLLLTWIVVPLLVAVLLAVRNVKPWNPRYVSVALPWLLLIAGTGLARLPRRWGAMVAVILVGLTVWSLVGYYTDGKYAKADLRQAARWVDSSVPASEPVLVPVVTGVFAFYDQGRHQLLDSYGLPPLAGRDMADAFVGHSLIGFDSCTIVLAREWYFDPDGYLLPALAGLGELEPVCRFPGVEILHWERRAMPRTEGGTGTENEL